MFLSFAKVNLEEIVTKTAIFGDSLIGRGQGNHIKSASLQSQMACQAGFRYTMQELRQSMKV